MSQFTRLCLALAAAEIVLAVLWIGWPNDPSGWAFGIVMAVYGGVMAGRIWEVRPRRKSPRSP